MGRFTSIELGDEFQSYTDTTGKKLSRLNGISGINLLVGANNSGKSRFMRLLALQESYKVNIQGLDLSLLNETITEGLNEIEAIFHVNGYSRINNIELTTITELKNLPGALETNTDSYRRWRENFKEWSAVSSINSTTGGGTASTNSTNIASRVSTAGSKAAEELSKVPIHTSDTSPKRVYIPILRGLRPFDSQHSDLYSERTARDYFAGENAGRTPEIFSGLTFYQRLTEMLLGDNAKRRLVTQYQNFVSNALFEGKPIALIPNPGQEVVVVKIGKELEQPVFHLGDGIQTVLILTFLPFVTTEETFFFIEEAESHLHPGLQRKLLQFFATQTKHHFFISTHSNHMLDLTMDIESASVFTFQKQLRSDDDSDSDDVTPSFSIEGVDDGESSTLGLLGVRNSSVFLVNATIWVEGITDRWYLRAMLNSYMQHLRDNDEPMMRIEEDVHYAFVEYGGSNITHWSFLDEEEYPITVERICARAMVVVDKDGESKLQRKEKLTRILHDRVIVLPGREIENLLPFSVIQAVVADYEGTQTLATEIIENEGYLDEKLGQYIETTLLNGNIHRRGGYADDSGTIKAKREFCKKAKDKILYKDLHVVAQQVIRRIYEFICSQNA